MINFLTLEDVNTVKFTNQGFWWYTADTALIDPNVSAEFSNVKLDFLTISKEKVDTYNYKFTVKVDNSLWTGGAYIINQREMPNAPQIQFTDDGFTVILRQGVFDFPAKIVLYMGITELHNVKERMRYYLDNNSVMNLPLNDLANKRVFVRMWGDIFVHGVTLSLTEGFNEVRYNNTFVGFILVNILKTDFQFTCNQQLTLGKVNTVKLGALTDYKPNGDLIGEYTPTINIFFENTDTLIPVKFDSTVNDYVFNIDLTDKQNEGKIRFYVNIDANEVINDSLTEVTLDCKFETINTFSKLQTLFNNGGIGRLGANITVTDDLTVTKSVYLIGNDRTLNMQSHKIIIPADNTFKAENTVFNNGKNTIQQNTGSNVELTNCTFTNCTGLGSVIDCQITTGSLSETDDFTTTLTGCTITNSDTAILHGGDLTVTKCTINGKIGLKEYPYFLYQTDGSAVLTSNQFSLTGDGVIDYDIEFNPCIFVCGENALINGLNYTEWSKNNLMDFLGLQKNRSSIDVTYYYDLIEDYVRLNSSEGYCHTVSDTDYVFKTNITINRGE